MWFYNQESSEIETITYLETGVQIIRSGNEIWWRGNAIDRPLEQDEMKIAERKSSTTAKNVFRKILTALKEKDQLAGIFDT